MTFTVSLTARPPSSSSGWPSGPITVFLSHTSRFASSGMSRKSAPLKRLSLTNMGLNS